MEDEDDEPIRRGGPRPWWILAAVVVVAAIVTTVILIVQGDDKEPAEFANEVASAFTEGGDDKIRSVFCESAEQRNSGVDVFALVRPVQVTVDRVVEKDDSHANALLVVKKASVRVFVWMAKQPSWCVREAVMCTPAAEPTGGQPAIPCDSLLRHG